MSQIFECGDNAALVTYLYDESPPEERIAIEAHLETCALCAAELATLASTSMQLAAWTPPEADLRFHLTSEARTATVLRPSRWWQQPLPAWAQAAAAAAIFATGLSLGALVESDVAVRVDPPSAAVAQAPAAAGAAAAVSRDELAALERRLRAEMAQRTAAAPMAAPTPVAATTGGGTADAQLLARVRALIEESEQRQRRELALRTADVVRDMDAQRQYDMARFQRVFGQFEGTAGAEIQRQRQDLNNLIRVSQGGR